MVTACRLCPRCCGANRSAGEVGWCRAGGQVQIYRYAPHFGEEPPISGSKGSGTIFFSRCTLSCLYCQNYPWSQQGEGDFYSDGDLAHALRALAEQGCHNWNLVSPTPWMPWVAHVLDALNREGIRLPVVYNTSGYERTETLDEYARHIQVYLTDLRYARAETALTASRAADYVEASRSALRLMWSRLGPLRCDENGVALSGLICRILVLPGLAQEAVDNLQWLASTVGTEVAISVMAQYHPAWQARQHAGWDRSVSGAEYRQVCEAMEDLGFENGWMQDPEEAVRDDVIGYTMPRGGFDKAAGVEGSGA